MPCTLPSWGMCVRVNYHMTSANHSFLHSPPGKVGMPNIPPGVTGVLPQHYTMGNPAAAAAASLPAFFGLPQMHQPNQAAAAAAAMYSAYGAAAAASPLDGLAALQRDATAAGLHSLVGAAAASNTAAAAAQLGSQSNQSKSAAAVTAQKQLLGMVKFRRSQSGYRLIEHCRPKASGHSSFIVHKSIVQTSGILGLPSVPPSVLYYPIYTDL